MIPFKFTQPIVVGQHYSLDLARKFSYAWIEDIQLEVSLNTAAGLWSLSNTIPVDSIPYNVATTSSVGFLTMVAADETIVYSNLPLFQLLQFPTSLFLFPGRALHRDYRYSGKFDFIKSYIMFSVVPPDPLPFTVPLTFHYRNIE